MSQLPPPLRSSRTLRLGLLVAGLGGLFVGADPRAQEAPIERFGFDVGFKPGAVRYALALPRPVGGSAAQEEFYSVLKRDLELTGYFDIIDPAAYIEASTAGLRPGSFRFEDWEVPGASILVKTGLSDQGGGMRSEVWVYHVPGRSKQGAKAFSGGASSVRMLAHKAANEVIESLFAHSGPFNTRFAVAGTFAGNKEIYVVDFDGHGLTPITRNGSINIQPDWDPSGTRIAYTGYAAGNPDTYVANLSGGRITRVSARPGINSGATWSPNGGLLALTLSPGSDSDVFTIDPNTGREVSRITREPGIDVSPSWSPDGGRIAFVSERSGGAQIYVANADGSGARRVTFQGNHNTDPAWSPDGESIAFVSRAGVFDIFTVRLSDSKITRITQAAGDNEDPSWSPDGHYIAFSSTRSGAAHIWMSTADGAYQVQLTQGKGGYTNPDWSPGLKW